MRPSVPCQERDWTSIIMEPTHIPRDQWSTAGAATSSGLSWCHIARDQWSAAGAATSSRLLDGRVSRMGWHSRDEQREELLDATDVETAEVKSESKETD